MSYPKSSPKEKQLLACSFTCKVRIKQGRQLSRSLVASKPYQDQVKSCFCNNVYIVYTDHYHADLQCNTQIEHATHRATILIP